MVNLKTLATILAISVLGISVSHAQPGDDFGNYKLIAHRGGVIDSATAENSLQALEKAVSAGYDRVEIDVRMSKDSVFIVHHDRDLTRYYDINSAVDSLPWPSIRALKGSVGNRMHTLDEILAAASGRIKVWR